MAFPTYGELLLNNNTGTPEPTVIRTDFESGPSRQFKMRSRTNTTRTLSILFTAAELASFETWFRGTDCDWGAAWFNWTDYLDGQAKLARVYEGKYAYLAETAGEGATLKYRVDLVLELVEG